MHQGPRQCKVRGAGVCPRSDRAIMAIDTERDHPKRRGQPILEPGRIARERRTVSAMISLFCRRKHQQSMGLCFECEALLTYAMARLDRCQYGAGKPVCIDCHTHCYRPDMRERIREIMRFAGPRMLLAHPLLAVAHLVDKVRKPPAITER